MGGTNTVRAADYIRGKLADKGIKHVFEVYGGAIPDLVDACAISDRLTYIPVLHEQAGGFAAEAYAKVNGKLGAAMATSGPGAQNLVTPIANCFYDSVPAIFLTGEAPSMFLRTSPDSRQRGFQEFPMHELIKPLTKYATRVDNSEDVPYELEKAIHIAQEGRKGPVLLHFPAEVPGQQIDPEQLRRFTKPKSKEYNLEIVDEQIDHFLQDLRSSKRPTMLVGAGVRWGNALEELEQASEALGIPMFPTWNAMDVVTSDNPNYGGRVGVCGGKGRNFGIQNSDLLLMLGSRLSLRVSGGGGVEHFARQAKKYMVEIDPTMLTQANEDVPLKEQIYCDAKVFLQRLNQRLPNEKPRDFSDWRDQVRHWRDKYDVVSRKQDFRLDANQGFTHPYAFMRILSQEMQEGDIVMADTGGNVTVFSQAFETKKGQRAFSSNGNSPMGFAFPAGIGAWLASDRKSDLNHNVVSIIGDGGFIMNEQEMQTLVTQKIPLKTIILNNHAYGFTRQFQQRKFGKSEACDSKGRSPYIPPDFIKLANAHGIAGMTLATNNESTMRQRIRQFLDAQTQVIFDVDIGDFTDYRPRIVGNDPLEDMVPRLPRDEFSENMIVPPVPGWEEAEY